VRARRETDIKRPAGQGGKGQICRVSCGEVKRQEGIQVNSRMMQARRRVRWILDTKKKGHQLLSGKENIVYSGKEKKRERRVLGDSAECQVGGKFQETQKGGEGASRHTREGTRKNCGEAKSCMGRTMSPESKAPEKEE